jgi:hypothetical protein
MEAELDKVTGRRHIIDELSYAQLSELQSNAGIVWKETSVGALLRLLEYVHGEVSERLQDWRRTVCSSCCCRRESRCCGMAPTMNA